VPVIISYRRIRTQKQFKDIGCRISVILNSPPTTRMLQTCGLPV